MQNVNTCHADAWWRLKSSVDPALNGNSNILSWPEQINCQKSVVLQLWEHGACAYNRNNTLWLLMVS